MGKYEPLGRYLRAQKFKRLSMSFAQIERIIGAKLPPSKRYPAWWSNNPHNNVMTREWLGAGYETESVDTVSGRLVFRRQPEARASGPEPRESIFGCMRGMITLAPGFDPTAPMGEEWLSDGIGGFGE